MLGRCLAFLAFIISHKGCQAKPQNRRTDDTTERYTNSDASGLVGPTILTWNIACIGNCLPSKHDARINKVAENQADTNAANDRPTERSCASGELMVTVRKSYNETSYSTRREDQSPATQSCRCKHQGSTMLLLVYQKSGKKAHNRGAQSAGQFFAEKR